MSLKDWPSNCSSELFDALPEAGSQTLLDFTEGKNYYARFHDNYTDESLVIPETSLAGLLGAAEENFTVVSGPFRFLGFYKDLEEIWWPDEDDENRKHPVPTGIVGVFEEYVNTPTFDRVKVVFYSVRKVPGGWLFSSQPNQFHVKPFHQWILDYTKAHEMNPDLPDLISDDETIMDSDEYEATVEFPASVTYRNPVFGV